MYGQGGGEDWDILRQALMKSTFVVYEKWELNSNESLRFYYFAVGERQRNWVIKRTGPRKGQPKHEIIPHQEALSLQGLIQPIMCLRYWDQVTRKEVRIEQQGMTCDIQVGQERQTLTESFASMFKRILG